MFLCWRCGAVPDAVPFTDAHLVGALVDPLLALLDLALQTGVAGQRVQLFAQIVLFLDNAFITSVGDTKSMAHNQVIEGGKGWVSSSVPNKFKR